MQLSLLLLSLTYRNRQLRGLCSPRFLFRLYSAAVPGLTKGFAGQSLAGQLSRLFTGFALLTCLALAQTDSAIHSALQAQAVPLQQAGLTVLIGEARGHDFFLLGELHGETEIPTLLGDLWPQLWESGYRHVAAEVSPWAADQLERATAHGTALIPGLWTVEQALTVRQFASPSQRVLWGCDIEEIQPNRLIAQLAAQNPGHSKLGQMLAITRAAYDRKQAPELSRIAQSFTPANDLRLSGVSLWESLRDTLRLEALRATPGCKLQASEAREQIMKHLFLTHYGADPEGKTFLRFGRNHLHRGYDARGISTLGNFVAEWALSHNQSVVNVGAFAAGGKEHILDSTVDVGERQDEGTFNLLANLAKDTATLFDLRPLRPILHAIPREKRPPLEANLVYWSDTYDFLICYPKVTPLP